MRPTSFLSLTVLLAALPFPSFAAPTCGLTGPKEQSSQTTAHSANGNGTSDEVVAAAWYPGWLSDTHPSSSLSWDKYTHMTFSFAVTAEDGSLSLDEQSQAELPLFVQNAKQHGVKALVSIGGWTGSRFFSTSVATNDNRTQFVKTVVDFATQWQLDGLDFDWEYPGGRGIGCNVNSTDDSANFLAFLQELHTDSRGKDLYLSAATGIKPFIGSDGQPMTNVSGFSEVLDHIAIMNYDLAGAWSDNVAANAPLDDACAPKGVGADAGSATSAIKDWSAAGFPAEKLVLGIAAYGHSFFVPASNALDANNQLRLYGAVDKNKQPFGDGETETNTKEPDACGNPGGVGGVFDFVALINNGFLSSDGKAASGIEYLFDNCSQTPFVYNQTSQVMISYDDATSFAAKGKFINDNNLKGFAMWHAVGDSGDILMDAISNAMGIEQVCSS